MRLIKTKLSFVLAIALISLSLIFVGCGEFISDSSSPTKLSIASTSTLDNNTPTLIPLPSNLLANAVSTNTVIGVNFITNTIILKNGSVFNIITPTNTLGSHIKHRALDVSGVKLQHTAEQAVISPEEALQILYNSRFPAIYTGSTNGYPFNVDLIYGLGTVGETIPYRQITSTNGVKVPENCKTWSGPCNYPLETCSSLTCKPSGEVLERIENRPMWIVNITISGSYTAQSKFGPPPNAKCAMPNGTTQPCNQAQTEGHFIYVLDALSKSILFVTAL